MKNIFFIYILQLIIFYPLNAQNDDKLDIKINEAYIYGRNKNYNTIAIELEFSGAKSLLYSDAFYAMFNGKRYDYRGFELMDLNGKIAEDQMYAWSVIDSSFKAIFLTVLPTITDTFDLHYVLGKKINSNPIKLKEGKLPTYSTKLIKNIRFLPFAGRCASERSGSHIILNLYDIYGQNSGSGLIDAEKAVLSMDTLNLNYLSAFDSNEKIWVGRSWRNKNGGGTNLVIGDINDPKDSKKWNRIKLADSLNVSDIFLQNDEIYLICEHGIYKVDNLKIIKDDSFDNITRFDNLNAYWSGIIDLDNGQKDVIWNDGVYRLKNNKWKRIYQFKETGNFQTTAVSFDGNGFYYLLNRKLYYSNYKKSTLCSVAIENIMAISKGPNKSIIFNQGSNSKGNIGGVYFPDDNSMFELKRKHLTNNTQIDFQNLQYRQVNESLIICSRLGLYEFKFEDFIKHVGIVKELD